MNARILIALLLVLLFVGGGTVIYNQTRGLRNNNPGNIRKSADQWQGAIPGTDEEFVTFSRPEFGIRAMAKILMNYQARYGINTLRGLVSRWAPPTENDTGAYVEHLARATGIPPDAPIDIAPLLPRIIPVIIKHENGLQPYDESVIQSGIQLAYA